MSKLALFAMTQKGFAVLQAIAERHASLLECVVGSRDPNIDADFYDDIQKFCSNAGIPFHDRANCPPIHAPYLLAVSWRWLIRHNAGTLIVIHDSLLPRYRGFNPLVSALLNGDDQLGATAILASDQYDRGEVIAQSAFPVTYPLKIQHAIDLIAESYRKIALHIVNTLAAGQQLQTLSQDESKASYSLWRDEEDYFLDWTRPASYLKRFVDAVSTPYKGAAACLEEKTVRILDALALPDVFIENRSPGKVIFINDGRPVVVCGTGLLEIRTLVDEQTRESLLPLSRFRLRFK